MKIRRGMTRIVLLIGRWAIKIPRPSSSQQFVLGCLANLAERSISVESRGDLRLAQTRWCALLGLISVQERVGEPLRVMPGINELEAIPLRDFCGGIAAQWHNCSRRNNGALVCFDYGAPSIMYVHDDG
jgi:hypothetical protein